MNDALTFAYKISQNNNTGEPKPDWRILNDKLKLEYGRTETLEKANNKAFTIVDYEINEIVDGYKNSTI
ncbi:unnamed protein product [Rhizophagus irregularis]|nr:unnamed protein product [Rhizophagus irregularis]